MEDWYRGACYFLYYQNAPIGCLTSTKYNDKVEITNMSLLTIYQGEKLSLMLVNYLIWHASLVENLNAVLVHTGNPAAYIIYQQYCGFSPIVLSHEDILHYNYLSRNFRWFKWPDVKIAP